MTPEQKDYDFWLKQVDQDGFLLKRVPERYKDYKMCFAAARKILPHDKAKFVKTFVPVELQEKVKLGLEFDKYTILYLGFGENMQILRDFQKDYKPLETIKYIDQEISFVAHKIHSYIESEYNTVADIQKIIQAFKENKEYQKVHSIVNANPATQSLEEIDMVSILDEGRKKIEIDFSSLFDNKQEQNKKLSQNKDKNKIVAKIHEKLSLKSNQLYKAIEQSVFSNIGEVLKTINRAVEEPISSNTKDIGAITAVMRSYRNIDFFVSTNLYFAGQIYKTNRDPKAIESIFERMKEKFNGLREDQVMPILNRGFELLSLKMTKSKLLYLERSKAQEKSQERNTAPKPKM